MSTITNRDIERKAEIAEEFNAVLHAAMLFHATGTKLAKPISHYKSELDSYINGFDPAYMNAKNKKKLNEIRNMLAPLSVSSAASLVAAVNQVLSETKHTHIDLLNYNKAGLKEGVGQKSDICVTIYNNSEPVLTKHISLKQYKKYGNIQVASGTYISTICGLSFDIVGRGKFAKPNGDTFMSKNHVNMKKAFIETYGTQTEKPLNELIAVTKQIHNNFRTMSVKPDKTQWKKACGEAAASALPSFTEILRIVQSKDSIVFKNRFLIRSGLKSSVDKEIIYSAFLKDEAVTFNTMLDKPFSDMVLSVNKATATLDITTAGQSARISFKDSASTVLVADTPLTINSNGAWANKDRWSEIDKMFVKKGQLRPIKAKQLDTSTNCWLNIHEACFKTILEHRGM